MTLPLARFTRPGAGSAARRLLPSAALAALLPVSALAQRLEAPPSARMDEPIRIRAVGLAPGSAAVLRAGMTDGEGRRWRASARFRADARGEVDLARDAPVRGTYSGVQPMGLVTSMELPGGDSRFIHPRVDSLALDLVLEVGGRAVDSARVQRRFRAPGVTVEEVREDGLVGRLFTPPGAGPFPGILVLGGSEGGLGGEDVAAQLASRGYAALVLAYFGVEPLPATLDEIPLEYFERALRRLRARASHSGRLALFGTSKGAEAALLLASRTDDVAAVVAYAPSSVVWGGMSRTPGHASWTRGGVSLPHVPPGVDPAYRPRRGQPLRPAVNFRYRMRDPAVRERARIPVERIAAPVLLVAGGDDQLWPSAPMAADIAARRSPGTTELLVYPGAGHLIGKAYLPAGSTLLGGGRLDTGGTPGANARAMADSWPRVLRFLERALTPTAGRE